jgi:Bacterial Ig-like domain (group 3)
VTTGYDLATGLGSVNIANLVKNWSSVTFLPSTTTLSATVNGQSATSITGITHGTPVSLSSTVAASQGGGTPTGAVALLATPNPIPNPPSASLSPSLSADILTLSDGTATSTNVILPGGQYNLTAHYQGDGTFGSSDSTPGIPVNISAEPSKTLISIPTFNATSGAETGNAPTSLVYGSLYLARIDVGNAQAKLSYPPQTVCTPPACPTGTVTWTDSYNGTPAAPLDGGTFALNSAGYTEDQIINLPGGTHVLSASYNGDDSFASSTGTYSLTLIPAPTSILIGGSGGLPVAGQLISVFINGQAQTLTGVAPTGTVTFLDGTAQLGSPVQVAGIPSTSSAQPSFIANANLQLNNPGQQTITANYSGDANYAASTSSLPLKVLIPTSLALSANSTSVQYGANTVLTATLTTNLKGPAITGSITFVGPLGVLGGATQTVGTDANGNATIQATLTTVLQGSEMVSAGYIGDPNYASSGSSISIQVNIPDFSLGPAGVTVVPTAGQSGSGQFAVTPVSQTPSTVNLTLSPFAISGYTISLGSQQVNLNGSPVSVTISMTPVSTASQDLKSNGHRAVLFARPKQNARPLGLLIALGAMVLLAFRASRTRTRALVAAALAGALAFLTSCGGGSTQPPPQQQPQATTITLSTSNAKVAVNQPFTITATITSQSSQPITGIVTFYNFGKIINETGVSNGQAQTGQGYINNVGLYQITATYSGDANNQASTTTTPLTQVLTGTVGAYVQGNTGTDSHSMQVIFGLQ